jgi:cytochrome c-type biogenesis protein CcmF
MALIGTSLIYISLVATFYALIVSLIGVKLGNNKLNTSSRNTVLLLAIFLITATIVLVISFVNNDFSIRYVSEHSSIAMKPIYTWVAFYAGNEGSLLYVVVVFAIMCAIYNLAKSGKDLKGTNIILMAIMAFFVLIMSTLANPFVENILIPEDGRGINPLLTHAGMFFHPPMLMAGLIGTAIPFAIVNGLLLTKSNIDEQIDFIRMWVIVIWAILAIGLLLGSWWAYTILGWGGYWAWDPIENVALMPWLTLTGFLHSIMAQKRRGVFRVWNIILIDIAFCLSLFGIFINRGGPVPSVHSFASSDLGWILLLFMILSVLFSFTILIKRVKLIKSSNEIQSILSREASFIYNNILLLGVTFVTFWGVIYPLISDITTGKTVTVAAPFYNQINGPLLLTLLALMGIGPLLPWRNSSSKTLLLATRTPTIIAVLITFVLLFLGITKIYPLISFFICTFVLICIIREFILGIIIRFKHGENILIALIKFISSNRPRYGGYIVHIAIICLAIAITGSSFYKVQKDIVLSPGEATEIGAYTVQYLESKTFEYSDRSELFHELKVTKVNNKSYELASWQAFYPKQNVTTVRAAIISTIINDVYIISTETTKDGGVVFRITINPLIWWMWLAGPILIIGSFIALWPEKNEKPQEYL